MTDTRTIVPTLLRAGLDELLSLPDGIASAITHIGLGTASYTPTDDMTAATAEIIRVPVIDSTSAIPGQAMFYAEVADWAGALTPIYEITFYLASGTPLAIYSSAVVELVLLEGSPNDLFYTLVLGALPADKLEIISTDVVFINDDSKAHNLSPLGFGAVGDGVTNDSAAFAQIEALGLVSVDLGGLTYLVDEMPFLASYKNGFFLVSGITYEKPISPFNYLWMGSFFGSRGVSFEPKTARRACYDGWTIATLTGVLDEHYIAKTKTGVRVQKAAGKMSGDSVVLVANLSQSMSKKMSGKGLFFNVTVRHGSDYSGAGVTAKVQTSNNIQQAITRADGLYTSGNKTILSKLLVPGKNLHGFRVAADAEQLAVVFTIPFSSSAALDDDFIDIDFVSVGDSADVTHFSRTFEHAGRFFNSSYPKGGYAGTPTALGGISAVSVDATNTQNRICIPIQTKLSVPPTAVCYGTDGQDLEIYDVDDDVSRFAMIENLADSGFVIRANSTIPVGNRCETHYTSEGVL